MNSNEVRNEIESEKQKLSSFLHKASKARSKWIKNNDWQKAIISEIGACIATGRLDLVENLLERQKKLIQLHNYLESIEYRETFDKDSTDIDLPNESKECSTQNSSES